MFDTVPIHIFYPQWYPVNPHIPYVESITQMARKRMTSIWALFRVSLLPFTYLRTKNPGSKKCIERSQEGRISLSWGRGQKENDVFHRAATLKEKYKYVFHRTTTFWCHISLTYMGFIRTNFSQEGRSHSRTVKPLLVVSKEASWSLVGVRERGRGVFFMLWAH